MFTKTVDSITKVFTQAIKDLESLEQTKYNEVAKIQQARADLDTFEKEAQTEIKRAVAVRTKLQSLTSI